MHKTWGHNLSAAMLKPENMQTRPLEQNFIMVNTYRTQGLNLKFVRKSIQLIVNILV